MKIVNLGKKDSILNHFICELRDIKIQKDRMRFRRNIERIGEIFAYEISKCMQYNQKKIVTPLGSLEASLMVENPVLATILRAGLPLHQGLLNYFDKSDNTFISAYREHTTGDNFNVKVEYMSSPELIEKTIILSDPMLASGTSMILALESLLNKGMPKHIHIVAIIASEKGVKYVQENAKIDSCTLWIGAIDQEMTKESYIVPGLGDAGDLSFGEKK